ncbi:MAG: M15 family metallopeptidase [Alphaproteobacteria bacterium]|nr:M15 family metallopeptidase [Alphaproteobacteria bacterium]
MNPTAAATSSGLPTGFVYLENINPSILTSLRYFGNENFIGQPINGYLDNRVVFTKEAAAALSQAQFLFQKEGYSVVVYDTYRPQTAVENFWQWSQNIEDQLKKAEYYPRIDKAKVFELGYIARRSGHSRGSTVDLSIIPLGQTVRSIECKPRTLQDGFEFLYLDDGTVDMGSHFDLFDDASHSQNSLITPQYQQRRLHFIEIMEQCGFVNYAKEWWHFTLKNEPFPNTYFDFPIK